jgi:hypothetical protein
LHHASAGFEVLKGRPIFVAAPRVDEMAAKRISDALPGRALLMYNHLGLKPQAQSLSPFGIKIPQRPDEQSLMSIE